MCDRHPPFDITQDRASSDLATAMDTAVRRAQRRKERQRITWHRGPFLRAFYVQDASRAADWTAEQEATA